MYYQYDIDKINTADHQALALEAARQGVVLLKNAGETLPLDASRGLSVAVIGPHANATDAMLGNYAGIPPFITSPYHGIKRYKPLHIQPTFPHVTHLICVSLIHLPTQLCQ